MSIVSENGLLDDQDYKVYKERSVGLKFKAQLFGGLAGATFFALLTQVAGALLSTGGLGALASMNPIIAAGFILVGTFCTYMAQKYFFEGNLLDSDFNVRKMGKAIRGPSPELPEPTPAKGVSILPTGVPAAGVAEDKADEAPTKTTQNNDSAPHTRITAERALADTMAARAANENTPTDKSVGSWEDKVSHRDETQIATARG